LLVEHSGLRAAGLSRTSILYDCRGAFDFGKVSIRLLKNDSATAVSQLKHEPIEKQIYKNREMTIAEVADLGGMSSEQFETDHKPGTDRSPVNLGTPIVNCI
jgi:hypothetical protein